MIYDDEGGSYEPTCFDVGNSGGCGCECPVFRRGECQSAEEINVDDVVDLYGCAEAIEILESYGNTFKDDIKRLEECLDEQNAPDDTETDILKITRDMFR